MGNILDYMQWRGDLTFAQDPFNDVDNLILSCLAYVNLDEISQVQGGSSISVKGLSEIYFHKHSEKELQADKSFIRMTPEVLRAMGKSRRFEKCTVRNYVNEVIEEQEMQFSAMEIALEDGSVYAAFRGTDDTIVGWKEDFNLSLGLVPAQEKARQYLDYVGEAAPGPFRVGGHSKGGNLAVYAALKCREDIREKIREIYCNDGPGFSSDFIDRDEMKRILPRLKRIIPEFSVIGMLLQHDKTPMIVKSSQKGLMAHDGFSWQVQGPSFVPARELNAGTEVFNDTLREWIEGMDREQRARFIDDLFSVIEASGSTQLSRIQEGGLKSAGAMLMRLEELPQETKDMVRELVTALFDDWIRNLWRLQR